MSSDFHTTHWSVVLTAQGDGTAAQAALQVLCETYYPPIHKYLLRRVTADHARQYGGRDATDLTHDFFACILEGRMFAQLQRDGASFRVYLLGALRHFLSQVRQRESAQKRGGGAVPVSLSESQWDEPESQNTDDALFDREWALAMIQRAIDTLDLEQDHQLLPWITQEMTAETRRQLAAKLGMSDVAVKVSLHRLRKKFRHNIRMLIAETVKDASEIDAELGLLIRALTLQR
jgi:RNA polymerase sigma-70 factor (ECF subfamily)